MERSAYRRIRWSVVVWAAGSLVVPQIGASTIYYVSTAGNDANDGLSWPAAKLTVQAGLNAATSGNEVWVAAGAYVQCITLKDGVALYGGFAGGETDLSQRNWTVNVTILDGNQVGSVVKTPSGAAQTTRIDGFTIRNGKASTGGGVYCNYGSPTIANNTVTGNSASSSAGGIYCGYQCTATIANNLIAGNSASSGGGIQCEYSSATIANNAIIGNIATDTDARGAGIFCSFHASPTIVNNTIAGNTLTDSSYAEGGGIYCDYSCSPTIANTLIAFNTSGIYKESGPGNPVVRYSCVYGNSMYNYSGLSDPTGANGNISTDPNFADLAYAGAHIQPGSPCRDAGDDSLVQGGWKDIDGQSRILGAHVDIGADESDGTTWSGDANVVVRVAPEGSDANDGSSWALAKRTVQAAINAASASAGDVWVKEGTYAERITLRSFVHVYGGFDGTQTVRSARDWSGHVTVLDGGQGGSVVTANVLARGSSTIDGFTLLNGNGTLSGSYRHGGGVYCYQASPTIANNTITGNTAYEGGGVYCEGFYLMIVNNTITANNASSDGGGIYCWRASAAVLGNAITGNSANSCGGGICCGTSSGARIAGNAITGNSAYLGAAVYNDFGNCLIANNAIASNTGSYRGAVHCVHSSPTITNNVIVGNSSHGIDCSDSSPAVTGNTIVGNSGNGLYCNSGAPTVTNTIVAFNASGIETASDPLSLRYNCVYGNGAFNYLGVADPTGTNGNLCADPRLANLSFGGAHIQPSSPCIDSGDDAVLQAGATDIDGQARRIGPHVDIGADESEGTTWPHGPSVTVRVSPTGNDANNGSSWGLAKRTVQAGIDALAQSGGEVWVKEGTYTERITLRNFVHVYGGFAGSEALRSARNWSIHLTILDGGQAGSTVAAEELGYAVSTVDGFIIRNGRGTLSGSDRYGGGVYCCYASPTIAHNTITGNTATGSYDCGGGLYCSEASPLITNNSIAGNSATSGGGVYCDSHSSPTITNNTIARNRATGSLGDGGGIYLDTLSSPIIANTIVAYNSSGIFGNAYQAALRYNCVYANTAYNFAYLTDPTGTNGNISAEPRFVRTPTRGPDGKWATADDDQGDMRLLPGSPCIDAARNLDVPVDTGDIDGDGNTRERLPFDVAGGTRFSNDPATPDTGAGTPPIVDIGAYEYGCGDVNGDGTVDVSDLLRLAWAFGASTGNPSYNPACDFDNDGGIDVNDLLYLAQTWGNAALAGDINGDGHVDAEDLLLFAASWGRRAGETGYDSRCDFNGNGAVDVSDLLIQAGNWGT